MLPSSNSPSAPSLPVPRPRPAVGSGGGSKSPVRTEHDGERACGVEASVREDCPGGGVHTRFSATKTGSKWRASSFSLSAHMHLQTYAMCMRTSTE